MLGGQSLVPCNIVPCPGSMNRAGNHLMIPCSCPGPNPFSTWCVLGKQTPSCQGDWSLVRSHDLELNQHGPEKHSLKNQISNMSLFEKMFEDKQVSPNELPILIKALISQAVG